MPRKRWTIGVVGVARWKGKTFNAEKQTTTTFLGRRKRIVYKTNLQTWYGMRRLYNDVKETNQTVAVIHTAFEDKPSTVALVQTKEGMSLIEKLEYAYRWTQNIMDSWSLKMPMDGNDDVTVMGEIVDGMGLRSTSVGDQILVGTEKYVVAPMGFTTLDGEPV